jgi:site-specific DNA-methyltransferase (adenine-specific)
MKGNDGKGNVEIRDDWETPKLLFEVLNNTYNFTFDCCATKENRKCKYFAHDFLRTVICPEDFCWMNPPFSKAYKMFEHFFKTVSQGVAIYRCDNLETKIWQDIILEKADWIFFPKGRIKYEHNSRLSKGARFPSALIGIGVPPPKDIEGKLLFCEGKIKHS